jgi:hypothetical protein
MKPPADSTPSPPAQAKPTPGADARRCSQCILPRGYPCVTFDAAGRCSLCRSHEPTHYLGLEALRKDVREILSKHPRRDYDCIAGVSGGRDSSYLLHLLKTELRLNVLALFVDHGLIPEVMRENVRGITRALDVPLVVHRHERLQRCFRPQFEAWLRRPRPQTVSSLCVGCKSTTITSHYKYARAHRVPALMWGGTPFESAGYKMDLMRAKAVPGRIFSYAVGYAREVLANPPLLLDPFRAATHLSEFYVFYGPYTSLGDRLHGTTGVAPFTEHVHWREEDVNNVLREKYAWRTLDGLKSTWRGDCYLAPIRAYLYRSMLGYDDKAPHLSALVRDGQVTREEALRREAQEDIPEDVLEFCCRGAGISMDAVRNAVERYRREA